MVFFRGKKKSIKMVSSSLFLFMWSAIPGSEVDSHCPSLDYIPHCFSREEGDTDFKPRMGHDSPMMQPICQQRLGGDSVQH